MVKHGTAVGQMELFPEPEMPNVLTVRSSMAVPKRREEVRQTVQSLMARLDRALDLYVQKTPLNDPEATELDMEIYRDTPEVPLNYVQACSTALGNCDDATTPLEDDEITLLQRETDLASEGKLKKRLRRGGYKPR